MKKNLESNIWKYTLILIANKRIFVAILGAYYLTIPGVTAKSIGTILLASSLAGFLFEIPSGYMSDKVGHKQALVLSRIFMVFSTIAFLVSENFLGLVAGGVLLSMAQAFLSGTGSAFMHETLRALKKENEYSRIIGKASSIGFAVPVVFMMAVPFLVSYSYKLPFLIGLIIDCIGLGASLFLVKPEVSQEHVDEIGATNFIQVMREGYRVGFFPPSFFLGILGGVLFAVGAFRAPYQVFLEIPVIWFGVYFGIGRALASLMLAYSGFIRKYFDLVTFYRFELFLYSIMICLLGIVSSSWVVVTLFFVSNGFTYGLSKIEEGFQLEIIKASKFKATLLSTWAQIDQAMGAIASFGLGWLIERFSYQSGFLIMGLALFLLLLPLYLYIAYNYRKIYSLQETIIQDM